MISIIIPVYNVEKYLSDCLDSVVNQTYKDLEIICVNDGSTDNSLDILNEYCSKDDRIFVVNKENGGLSSARNAGLAVAKGDFIMFLDSDDWIDNNTCEVALKQMMESNSDVAIWSYSKEYEASSKEVHIFENDIVFSSDNDLASLHRRFVGLYKDELRYPEKADSIVTAWGKLYKNKLIINEDIKFIDTKIIGTEDALFNLYVFKNVKKAVYINRCFNHYRKTNYSSLTKSYKSQLWNQWNNLFDYINDYISENELDYSFYNALNNRISLSIIGLGLNIAKSNVKHKFEKIKHIISSNRYRQAVKNLELKYFPAHWKIFFLLAKLNFAFGLFLMLKCIIKLKGK